MVAEKEKKGKGGEEVNDKRGFYFEPYFDKKTFIIAVSVGYDSLRGDFCIWIRLGFSGVYLGYKGEAFWPE